MMGSSSYLRRRDQLTTYFDKTAAAAWQALTSNDPVNRIRATVRAGRDDMRSTLMSWLPEDLSGKTLLDAGCGTGALAVDAAKRGAHVIAIDVAANLVDVAKKRAAESGSAPMSWPAPWGRTWPSKSSGTPRLVPVTAVPM